MRISRYAFIRVARFNCSVQLPFFVAQDPVLMNQKDSDHHSNTSYRPTTPPLQEKHYQIPSDADRAR